MRAFTKFETALFALPIHKGACAMAPLRRLAARVWRAEGIAAPLPRIVAGRGVERSGAALASYCQGDYIVLSRHQRCPTILLHELAHAIAQDPPPYHGLEFIKLYCRLLVKYGNIEAMLLKSLVNQHNLV